MAIVLKELVPTKQLENVQTTQYTATNVIASIDKATVTNISGGIIVVDVNLVESGGSAGISNLVVQSKAVQPNETYTFPELVGHVLSNGSFISTNCDTATASVFRVSGREIS